MLELLLPIAVLTALTAGLLHALLRAVTSRLGGLTDEKETAAASLSLFLAVLFVLLVYSQATASQPFQPLLIILVLALTAGLFEQRFRLTTQFSLPARLVLSGAMIASGYHLQFAESTLGQFGAYSVSLIFHLGIFYSLNLVDRLKGLAPGVVMIVGMGLFTISLRSPGPDTLLFLIAAMGSMGLLFVMQSDRRLRLGSGGQLVLGVLLSAGAQSEHGRQLTATAAAFPLLALGVPIGEAAWRTLHQLSHGRGSDGASRLLSMLQVIGFTQRWLVFLLWIVTLQVVVIAILASEAESQWFGIGAMLSFPLIFLFVVACLNRIADRLERNREPGKLRILFLSHYFPPEVNAPANRLHEHARHWVAAGHQVTVICPAPSAPHGRLYPQYENALWQEEDIDGVRVIRVWTFIAANRGRIRRIVNYVSYMISALGALFLVKRHDVLVATSPQFFCGLAGAIGSVFRREKFVLEVRDIWPESVEAVGVVRHRAVLLLIRKLAEGMYGRALRLVTVGDGYKTRLKAMGVSPEKIDVIPNGIEPAWIAQESPLPIELPEGRFVVSYIGTLGLAHGLRVLLEAAEELPASEFHFLIVGDGAENEMLRREVAARGLTNISFTGLVRRDEVPAILRSSDACLVHLRRHAAFESVLPSKLFEAMAAGRPIILGARGSAAALLDEANAGLTIEPENAPQLANAVRILSQEKEKRQSFGENGRRFVFENYLRSRFAREYVTVLQGLMEINPLAAEDPEEQPKPTPLPVRAHSE